MTTLQYNKDDVAILQGKTPTLTEIDVMARKYNPLHDQEIASLVVRQLHKIGDLIGLHH